MLSKAQLRSAGGRAGGTGTDFILIRLDVTLP